VANNEAVRLLCIETTQNARQSQALTSRNYQFTQGAREPTRTHAWHHPGQLPAVRPVFFAHGLLMPVTSFRARVCIYLFA